MRALRFAGALVAALLLHLVLVAIAPPLSRFVDPFLLVVVLNALGGNLLGAMIGGAVVGLVEDAVTGGLFGLHGFAGTLVGYVVARAAQVLTLQKLYFVGLVFSSAELLRQLVLDALLLLLFRRPELPTLLELIARVLLSGLLGALLVVSRERMSEAVTRWRRTRKPRLSLE